MLAAADRRAAMLIDVPNAISAVTNADATPSFHFVIKFIALALASPSRPPHCQPPLTGTLIAGALPLSSQITAQCGSRPAEAPMVVQPGDFRRITSG